MPVDRHGRPRLGGDLDLLRHLRGLTPERLRLVLDSMGPADVEALIGAWGMWAHEGQLPPDGGWSTWVIKAGRGFGKTLAGAQWLTGLIAAAADGGPGSGSGGGSGGRGLSIALVGASLDDARAVMVEGRSGLLTVARPWVEEWRPSLRRLRFVGGTEATLFSGASPDLLRGPEHHVAWCDELAKWERGRACWDMLQLGLRLSDPATGAAPRALVTTTPQAGAVLGQIMAAPGTVVTGGGTRSNPHLSAAWKAQVVALYAGTRLGRQELDGEMLPDAGALWTVELIERCRVAVPPAEGRGAMDRVLIAVDPPSGDGTCGIVACARAADGIAHVLADHSVTGRSPEGWARAVADAAALHGTLEVLAEGNQGGQMVKAVLLTASAALRVRMVTATVGKVTRAEPVAMMFEAGRVRLHGSMPELEAQLLGMIAGGGYEGPGKSPDRADAMVWGVGEVTRRRAEARVRGLGAPA